MALEACFLFSDEDCSAPENWDVQFIESPVQGEKRGRDINLAIDGDTLHVSYRDVDPPKPGVIGDNKGVLKYVKGVKNGADWDWSPVPVIVDDTENGVTDTYIAFHAGSVHISYRKVGAVSSDDVIAYATCSSSCDSSGGGIYSTATTEIMQDLQTISLSRIQPSISAITWMER